MNHTVNNRKFREHHRSFKIRFYHSFVCNKKLFHAHALMEMNIRAVTDAEIIAAFTALNILEQDDTAHDFYFNLD